MATNEDMIAAWNEDLGHVWVRRRELLDAPATPLGQAAMDALDLSPGLSVLDVGCGTGATSRELAERVSPGGQVTGVDVSRPMLDAARCLARLDDLDLDDEARALFLHAGARRVFDLPQPSSDAAVVPCEIEAPRAPFASDTG